jgi:cytochrome P450 PksS
MTATERYAAEGAEIAGHSIPRGALVYAVLASANRDPAAFDEPDRLDLSRRPNRHLAFGDGIHFCAGAALARMEAQIAVPALIRRLPNLRLAAPADSLRWKGGLVVRALKRLPVSF